MLAVAQIEVMHAHILCHGLGVGAELLHGGDLLGGLNAEFCFGADDEEIAVGLNWDGGTLIFRDRGQKLARSLPVAAEYSHDAAGKIDDLALVRAYLREIYPATLSKLVHDLHIVAIIGNTIP